MTASTILMVGLAVLFLLLFWLTLMRRRAIRWMGLPALKTTAPPVDKAERDASAASEMIERLVNEALATAGLPAKRVDFATAHDGSLEIWVGDERFTSVESIPDPVIRKAVTEAVTAFNQRRP